MKEYKLHNGRTVRTVSKRRYLIIGGRGQILFQRDSLDSTKALLLNQFEACPYQRFEVIDQESGDTIPIVIDEEWCEVSQKDCDYYRTLWPFPCPKHQPKEDH